MSFFSYDNLGGEFPLIEESLRQGLPSAVFGVPDESKYLIASLTEGRAVYITADPLSARRAHDAISVLSGRKTVLLSAKDEVLLYRRAGSKDALYRRLTALYEWERGAEILVCDVEALIQLVPKHLKVFHLAVGGETDMRALVSALAQAGYQREYTVDGRGAFSVRGDILDIWPINEAHPVRIDFFGDSVEAVKPYDEETGERYEKLSSVDIVAATDALLGEGEAPSVDEKLKREISSLPVSVRARMEGAREEMETDGFLSDFLLPLLEGSGEFLRDLAGDPLVIIDEGKLIRDKIEGLYREHGERFKLLLKGGEALPCSERQYIPREHIDSLSGYRTLTLQTFMGNPFLTNPLKIFNYKTTPVRRYLNSAAELSADLRTWMQTGYRVMVYCGNGERVQKLREELAGAFLPLSPLPARLEELSGVALLPANLEHGFLVHDCKLAVIGTGDLFTKAVKERRIRKKRGDLFVAPEVGDYAVHETYGVGRITGTKKIETTDGTKEYIALEYKDGDTLYVPVENMDVLSKYMGGDSPQLSKIGGGEFERVKARVRASLKKMAFDLKALYAERQEKVGYAFPEYPELMDEFIAAFPYEDTPDQTSSFEEIKEDMCSKKVMDRLLVGDVGFGKTEVALRAAYLCVLSGRQAALMCPSTVLSEQHYQTALERMKDFGVRVACLNRFRTDREAAKALADVASGAADLVIGTHRLLSADVKFHDLGLLILDEEQRFGVEHKEKIKNYKRDVDCLTMTATPIPRTLHLSLSGIRDISTIRTPPQARLPVQTYVAEETETLLRDAILREIARKGQTFVLYNRVESIYAFAARLKEIVPEANVCIAHGRMDRASLERNVFGFYRGEYDVLVTTTIIENGIDLPNANTLIVIDADRLGISQLYQLRGRVGRSSRLAHAYFTYKPERVMTENASERLKAIMQFTELGSGFKIAMRDLEIRGAGNVLGAEQHGHMDKVGYELYAKILKEELTGVKEEGVELDIKSTAYIPESYVESNAGRMDCYKQIAEIGGASDYKRVCSSMEETYGRMPEETLNLLIIALMKAYARKLGVRKISVSGKGGRLEFASLNTLGEEKLAAAMEAFKGKFRLEMTTSPALAFPFLGDGSRTMVQMTKFLKFAATFT